MFYLIQLKDQMEYWSVIDVTVDLSVVQSFWSTKQIIVQRKLLHSDLPIDFNVKNVYRPSQ